MSHYGETAKRRIRVQIWKPATQSVFAIDSVILRGKSEAPCQFPYLCCKTSSTEHCYLTRMAGCALKIFNIFIKLASLCGDVDSFYHLPTQAQGKAKLTYPHRVRAQV